MADSRTTQAPVAADTADVGKLVQQLKQLQRELWQQGQREQAEALLEKHPQLAHAPEAFSLIYGEFLLSEEFGVTPHLGRFKERFPHFAERLDDQVKLHNIFSNSARRHSTEPANHQLIPDLSPIPDIPGFDQFSLLGRGGMGLVFKARQVNLDRWVAIKMMIGGIYAGQESLARFRTEAEAVGHLDHPNIVPIHEVGEWRGLLYFSMRLIACGTLAQHLPRYKKDRQAAVRLVAEIARALHYAHQRGILHRDLKPHNILLDAEGRPYVTDFGLAKRVDRQEALTGSQGCVGTPGYIAPEQAAGQRNATVAVDVWGLGTILYELLTQHAPYAFETPLKAIQDVLTHDPKRPRYFDTSIETDLETICLKALAREPEKRYASAQAMAEDLDHWLAGDPIQARPSQVHERVWRWCKRRPAVAGLIVSVFLTACLGVAGITIAWLHALDGWGQADEMATRANLEHQQVLKRKDEAEDQLYFSRLAQASFEERSNNPSSAARLLDLCIPTHQSDTDRRQWEWHYLKGLLHSELVAIPEPHEELVFDVSFSPDGQQLLTAGGSPYRPYPPDKVKVWNIWEGSKPRLLKEFAHPRYLQHARFLPEGKRIAWVGDDRLNIFVASLETGVIQTLPLPSHAASIALSDDVARYVVRLGNVLQVYDLATQKQIDELTLVESVLHNFAFNHQGTALAAASEQGMVLYELATKKSLTVPVGQAVRSRPSFSPDGQLVALGLNGGQIRIWNVADGMQLHNLSGHDGDVRACVFSPDGQTLASTGADRTVRLWNLQSSAEQLRLRGHQGRGIALCFHPSGRYLASGAGQPSEVKIWDLSRQQEFLTIKQPAGGKRVEALQFSSDNQSLSILRALGMIQQVDARNGLPRAIRPIDLTGRPIRPSVIAVWSTNNQWLACVSQKNTSIAQLLDAQGNVKHQLTHQAEVKHMAFSRDGTQLVTSAPAASAGKSREIKIWDVNTGKLLRLIECDPFVEDRTYGAVALSPDGSMIVHDVYEKPVEGKDRFCHVVVRNTSTGELVLRLPGPLHRTERIVLNQQGNLLAMSCEKKGVLIFDLVKQQWLHGEPLPGATNRTSIETIWDLAFSPDGQRLAGASRTQVLLWDTRTGNRVLTLRGAAPPSGDNGFNARVVWSPDGRRLAASNADATVSIWDAGDRESPVAKKAMFQAAEERNPK